MADNLLSLTIYDQEYTIKLGSNDPEYVKTLAKAVHDRMCEYHKMFPGMDAKTTAILSALNFANERYTAEQKREREDGSIFLKKIKNTLDQEDAPFKPSSHFDEPEKSALKQEKS